MQKFAARTDPGKKRTHNEDALLALAEFGVYVVADGVGGRACGEVASALCIEAFRNAAPMLRERLTAHSARPDLEARNAVLVAMDEVLQQASRTIYETAETEGRTGMTTTVVRASTWRVTAAVSTIFIRRPPAWPRHEHAARPHGCAIIEHLF